MNKFFFILLLIFFSPLLALSTDIYQLKPVEIYPGTEVTVFGKNFNENTLIILGNKAIRPHSIFNEKLRFFVPINTEPGSYILSLKTDRRDILPTFTITVKNKDFVIKNFYPHTIERCSEADTVITVEGEQLDTVKKLTIQGSSLYFNYSKNKIIFELPGSLIDRNSYLNIYFYNQDEKIKDLITININNKPFIEQAKIISSELTSIDLRISGKNFIYPLKLFVNNELIKERGSEAQIKEPLRMSPMLDRFEFINCNEIIYKRYPTSSETKELLIYIENPTGEKSNTYSISVP